MWWFDKTSKKSNDAKKYEVHMRYLRLLYSSFDKKREEFSRVTLERSEIDRNILYQQSILKTIIQSTFADIKNSKNPESVINKIKSGGLTFAEAQTIIDTAKRYGTYQNLMNAYYWLLIKEVQLYKEILVGLNESQGPLNSLQKIYDNAPDKNLKYFAETLIKTLANIKEYIQARIEIAGKILQGIDKPLQFEKFQKLIGQNINLDNNATTMYSELIKKKETLPAQVKEKVNIKIRGIPEKSSLAASILLALTLLAGACGGLQEPPVENSQPQKTRPTGPERKKPRIKEEKIEGERQQAPQEGKTPRQEENAPTRPAQEKNTPRPEEQTPEPQRPQEKYARHETPRAYEQIYRILDDCNTTAKKENPTNEEIGDMITKFKTAREMIQRLPTEGGLIGSFTISTSSKSSRSNVTNTTTKTYSYDYDKIEENIIPAYRSIISSAVGQVMKMYLRGAHNNPEGLKEMFNIIYPTENFINWAKKNGIEDQTVNELNSKLLKIQVRMAFERDNETITSGQ